MKFNRLFSTILLQLISIAIFGNGNTVSHYDEAPLIDHLVSINKEWNKQKDVPTDLLTIPMKFNTDDERIQLHLKLVESILNKRSSDHLTVQQFINRKKNLQSLVEYWREGQFPINTRHSHRQPYFIDDFGTACAVGHLLLTSGEEDLAHHISGVQNYAYIHEMNYPELDEWANENGFTEDELAWIQPGYEEGICYYIDEINEGQQYSDVNQPLSQQEIKTIQYIPGEGMIYGGNFLHYDTDSGTQTASVFGQSNGNYVSYGNSIQGTVYDIEYFNQVMYIAGDFVLAGTNFHNIAYWNGTDWVGIQTGDMGGIIKDMIVYNCRLYVGGDFTTIDGTNIANLAIWNGTTWSTTPQNCAIQSATQPLQVNGAVNTFEVYNNKLAIGGDFTQVMGSSNTVEGLIFWHNLAVEFLPTHSSMSSVNNLATYQSVLVVGEDSLCAYRGGEWYYPGDDVHQPELDLPSYMAETWQIPPITNIHDIHYTFGDLGGSSVFGFDHLMISANDEVWAINSGHIDDPDVISVEYHSDYRLKVDGTVSAILGGGYNVLYGGNFNTIDVLSLYGWNINCQGTPHQANKLFSLTRNVFFPVELAEFTVNSADNKTALLQWTSQTEKNSIHYEIQRKVDDGDFMRVNTVAAAGESLEEIDYTYEDDISKINGNYVYYRLKMVDKDGSFEYSDVRSLKLRTIKPDISVSPNPAQNTVALDLQLALDETVMVNIYNLQGQQINSYTWAYTNTNSQKQIDVSHLLSGVYILEVVSSQGRATKKLDIIK